MGKVKRTIRKSDLVIKIAHKVGIHLFDVQKIVDCFTEFINESLLEGHRIEIRDFGVFETVTVSQKEGYNFHTKKKIKIPSRKKVIYKMPKNLKKGLRDR